MNRSRHPFTVNSNTIFWDSETSVDAPSAFQISLTAPSSVSLSNLAFSSLAVTFSHDERPFLITHSDEHSAEGALMEESIRVVEVGTVSSSSDAPSPKEVRANLRWGKGTTVVISGTVISGTPATLTVSEPPTVSVVVVADSRRLAVTFRSPTSS